MINKELVTEIRINATAERVWQLLTNFEDYPTWNSFITSLKGNVNVGETINVHLAGMNFKPKVLVFEENQEFKWRGKLLFGGLFDGEHRFLLVPNQDGSTTLRHSEKFSGILIPFMKKMIEVDTKNNFQRMNQELKALAER